jgi:hypothetical protein
LFWKQAESQKSKTDRTKDKVERKGGRSKDWKNRKDWTGKLKVLDLGEFQECGLGG